MDNNRCSWSKVQQFLIKNFLPLGLIVALIIGLAWPVPGDFLGSLKVGDYSIIKTINVCIIFFVSGLTLKTSEIKAALHAYLAFSYALVAILLVTPLAGFVALELPFDPYEFAIGLAVFCAVPTTLTSGATLVMQANGNYALALMITVCSNVLGVITVPFFLKLILEGVVEGVSIDAVKLLIKLILTILVPLVIGKCVRHTNKKILRFGKKHKTVFSMVNNGSLIMIVWQTISQSQESIVNTRFTSILLLIGAGILLHTAYLLFNYLMTKIGRWDTQEQRAVLLLTSQKTLPVSVTIISYFSAAVGDKGLIILPCIIGHLSQLFMDSFIVSAWNAKDEKIKQKQEQQKQMADNLSQGDLDEMEANIDQSEKAEKGGYVQVIMDSDLNLKGIDKQVSMESNSSEDEDKQKQYQIPAEQSMV